MDRTIAEENVTDPTSAKTLADLRGLTDDRLVELPDKFVAGGRPIDHAYYLEELARRAAARREQRLVWLTWAIAAMTLVNVVAVVVSLGD